MNPFFLLSSKNIVKYLLILNIIVLPLFVFIYYQNKGNDLIYPIIDKNSIFRKYTNSSDRNVIYGYLPWWQLEELEYIQLNRITDIAYFGLRINGDGTIQTNLEDGTLEPGYSRWNSSQKLADFIKQAQKYHVRVSLTVISHIDDNSNDFLDCNSCWNTLANQLITQMNKHNIKDLNINFEYVEGTPKDKASKYNQFVAYINEFMDNKYGDSFVVTSAFADSASGTRISSEITELSRASDGIFIMGYDFHVPTSSNAGPVAPYDKIEKTVNEFLAYSPANKLILGVPYYGYNWVVDSDVLGASRIEGNDYIGYSASQIYSGIKQTINETNSTVYFNEVSKTPYFNYTSPTTNSLRQVHFENKESLEYKYDLIKSKNLLGLGIWALGYDSGHTELWDLINQEFWNL